jgi:hypothetical protein
MRCSPVKHHKMSAALIITIDTEEDCWGEYRTSDNPVMNVRRMGMLQSVFDQYGAIPTYLVDWPVMMDQEACFILREIHGGGRCEIGSHCHPWNTPPFEEPINSRNSMLCNLPGELIREKLLRLHDATIERLEVKPRVFRSGRWGFGGRVAYNLLEAGYEIDTSVCPSVDWSSEFGPDFSYAPDEPYFFNPAQVLRPDPEGKMLEVPATIGYFQNNDQFCRKLQERLRKPFFSRLHSLGVLDRLHLLNLRWLSPELSTTGDMLHLCQVLLDKGHSLLNMSFHSTSLLPGSSPFVRDNDDMKVFMQRIRSVLEFAVEKSIKFLPLASALAELSCQRNKGKNEQ